MLIDLHCHSKYSNDNSLEPELVIKRAKRIGLDGVCFTEHHSYDASWPVEKINLPDDFLVFRGVEISTNKGHVLVYGVKDDSWNTWDRDYYLDVSKLIRNVHALGGICVPAHPYRGWESIGEALFTIARFDAIETHNGANSVMQNVEAEQAARKLALPSIGGSDCHQSAQIAGAFTEFKNRIWTMDDLVAEIKKGAGRGRIQEKFGFALFS